MRLNIQLPDFLIIGAQKAGTTSIHHYCKQHPNIFMTDAKEPMFFSSTKLPDISWEARSAENPYSFFYLQEYAELFKNAGQTPAVGKSYFSALAKRFGMLPSHLLLGEASTAYLANPASSIWIKKIIPSVKIIAVLRNPLHRALSAFTMYSNVGVDKRSFDEAVDMGLKEKEHLVPQGQRYLSLGLYAEQLAPFLKLFPKDQIFIGNYDEYASDNIGFLQKIFRFLQIEPFRPKELMRVNVFTTEKNIVLEKTLEKKLKAFFKEDILSLQNMVDFDVSKWIA